MSAAATRTTLVRTDQDVFDRSHLAGAIHLGALERNSGGRLDPRVINAMLGVYNVFRKAACVSGRHAGYITIFDLGQALYPDVMNGDDARRKSGSIRRQLRRLGAAGVLRTRAHESEAGQTLGLWWELVDEAPDPEAWPDLRTYSRPRYPQRARPCSSTGVPTPPRRPACVLQPREKLRRSDPRRRVHRWNRRIGHGAEHRYDVLPQPSSAFFSDQTFGAPTSFPAPLGLRPGGGEASEVRERRAQAPAAPRPWAALTRCRTAAGAGEARAVLGVPRADWPSMAAAAFEARFVADGDGSWWTLGDPHFRERDVPPSVAVDPELAAPEHRHRYITLSGPWARRLETWCRTYDRSAGQPGAGIRSLVEDIADWQPADGAPCRGGADPGWPVSLAFFVARLGRRAKARRNGCQPKRRHHAVQWSEGERWST